MTEKNARYEGDWYYCWLIEKRGLSIPLWLMSNGEWTPTAHHAMWFARRIDAETFRVHSDNDFVRIVVCEHGFMLAVPTSAEPCTCGIGMSSLRPHDRSCPMATAK